PSSQKVTKYVVRVPKNTTKKCNIMAFNAADKVNFATWNQARMKWDLSNKKIYTNDKYVRIGSSSEFNRRLREAQRKKYRIVLKEFWPEDQPWLLQVNVQGHQEGRVTENMSYYIFTQCPDWAFEAFRVHNWYNFTLLARHRTLTAEEAEEEWERRNKVLNHFSIMQQRRLKDQDQDEDEEKEKRGRRKANELRIRDLEMSSDASNASGEERGRAPKAKNKEPLAKGSRKKKKGSDDEAFEDSDDGDFEGQEVDYVSEGSSSSQDEPESKAKAPQQEEGPKGEEEKAPTLQEKKGRKDSKWKPSGRSWRGNSRPGTPSAEGGSTSSTLRATASKLQQGKRVSEMPAAKRLRLDAQPSGKSTPRSGDMQVTEDAVRRYLTGKPMTTRDLLKRFQTKKTGLISDQIVNVLTQILRALNPESKMISDKMHFSPKE
uniref:Transcription initiation factor IIF subunit alpha n=1 Tax=Rhinopithecus bieti TaxID=61621 RepID=A0A2K6JWH0_RHIBE